jgi:Domain of unknown function (DUF3786)
MEHSHSSSSSPWEQGFDLSYKFACERLAKIVAIQDQCHRSSARYVASNEIVVDYLNQPYHIVVDECRISLENSDKEIPLRDRILILHYFTGAKGTPATGKLIAFKQLSGGASYFPTFSHRSIVPLVKNFGKSPELLIKTAAKLGGHEAGYGDVSVTVNAFPRVPITLVLWRGDDELAPNGSILFDANIADYVATEDVTVLCETIIWKLVKSIPST